jgi:hypothetical protein
VQREILEFLRKRVGRPFLTGILDGKKPDDCGGDQDDDHGNHKPWPYACCVH